MMKTNLLICVVAFLNSTESLASAPSTVPPLPPSNSSCGDVPGFGPIDTWSSCSEACKFFGMEHSVDWQDTSATIDGVKTVTRSCSCPATICDQTETIAAPTPAPTPAPAPLPPSDDTSSASGVKLAAVVAGLFVSFFSF